VTSLSFPFVFYFVDLIKEIILNILFQLIHGIVDTKQLTIAVTTAFMQVIYNKLQKDFWIPRCKFIIEREKYLNIMLCDKSTKEKGG